MAGAWLDCCLELQGTEGVLIILLLFLNSKHRGKAGWFVALPNDLIIVVDQRFCVAAQQKKKMRQAMRSILYCC